MKKADIKLGFTTMGIAITYYLLTSQIPEKAAFYPKFVAILLSILSLIFLVKTAMTKYEDNGRNLFEDMKVKQYFFVISVSFVYVSLINILGYFVSTFIFIIICLLGLKTKKLYAFLTTIGFCIFVFIIFKILLRVPLPKGFIF
ncbi:tripartite tricarboxylate transporter TctB family protein [Paramaledivibacter caminithermalis]|uniref:Putative tricarboxylic transport membrane protein n=1 Tax=Paramaledivibacter caminithermalis (strain DSM 15212 / CIP 107654 / DViRD3) TaxID=1121301 RepID=A0A1M6K2M6_PARC5|nr:tripartite tricarboxylate transporter TctB family protein [Paramaledivibacter caminithermalis]SHJ53168.1 putative tricarboxylic transport membrane protein [Paramaledivibacter caminithermalis DSM 15212]